MFKKVLFLVLILALFGGYGCKKKGEVRETAEPKVEEIKPEEEVTPEEEVKPEGEEIEEEESGEE